MITKETWPVYHGSHYDGTEVIIRNMGFAGDVKYGKSKIFIRSPQTLFALEEERDKYIPHIVLFLQKVILVKFSHFALLTESNVSKFLFAKFRCRLW
jgi:myosin-1